MARAKEQKKPDAAYYVIDTIEDKVLQVYKNYFEAQKYVEDLLLCGEGANVVIATTIAAVESTLVEL